MDSKNPLNYVLPAGVLAYVASPDVRKGVRSVLVKGMAGVMDMMEKAESASESLRNEFTGIMSDAERMRQEAKQPPVHIHVEDAEAPEPEGAPSQRESRSGALARRYGFLYSPSPLHAAR